MVSMNTRRDTCGNHGASHEEVVTLRVSAPRLQEQRVALRRDPPTEGHHGTGLMEDRTTLPMQTFRLAKASKRFSNRSIPMKEHAACQRWPGPNASHGGYGYSASFGWP